MGAILEHLRKVEGTTVHRQPNEKDITAPFGVYKYIHPDAKIFKFIDEIALEVGIRTNSKRWRKIELEKINDRIVTKNYTPEIEKLVQDFYGDYLKGAHITMFPKQCSLAMFSMYTHSAEHSFEAVQESLNSFVRSRHINYKIQGVDGSYGKDTRDGLKLVKGLSEDEPLYGFLFEANMIGHMSRIYGILVADNPAKYLRYQKGWDNRIIKLLDER